MTFPMTTNFSPVSNRAYPAAPTGDAPAESYPQFPERQSGSGASRVASEAARSRNSGEVHMALHVSLVQAPGLPSYCRIGTRADGAAEELVINTDVLDTGARLQEHLAATRGRARFTVDGHPLEDLTPGQHGLRSGAVIVAAPEHLPAPRPRADGQRRPVLVFAVHSGPDAGQLTALERGSFPIGRSGSRITIRDTDISRAHAVLTVGEDRITLRDLSSANGTWVDGVRVTETVVTTDSRIRLGTSRCRIWLHGQSAPRVDCPADLSRPVEVDAPAVPERNRMQWVTALLPLVLGVVLAVTTGMWFFLAFSGLSAVTALIPAVSGARRRRRFDALVQRAAAADADRRRLAAPDPGNIAIAVLQDPRERAACTADPAATTATAYIRLGSAEQAADVAVKGAGQGWERQCFRACPYCWPCPGSTPGDRPTAPSRT
jgi:S-DNA-T family DNA segregation ATPase FtsK/SpoIIIE